MVQATRVLDLVGAENLRRQELQQRLRAVEKARPVAGGNYNALGRELQLITFGAQGGGRLLGDKQDRVADRTLPI